MAWSPDHRVFATDMHNLADNRLGKIYILEGWDEKAGKFTKITTYLDRLRNPNNLAFYTEPAHDGKPGQSWLYVPLTDKLVRYSYSAGDERPLSPPEVLAHYPDYGLSYKYGGWHLTRTVAVATLHGKTRVYVTVGSSCDACREKEEIRATLTAMDPDGSHAGSLPAACATPWAWRLCPRSTAEPSSRPTWEPITWATANPKTRFSSSAARPIPLRPEPTSAGPPATSRTARRTPTCSSRTLSPPIISFPPPPAGPPPPPFDCAKIPAVYTTFAAHSSPLGVEYFDSSNAALKDSFLVALHGASHPSIGTGYRVVRFTPGHREPQDFITGFLDRGKVRGRPCGILRVGPDEFLLTDDLDGAIYYVHAGS